MHFTVSRASLERLYDRFNHTRYVSPDPLELVLRYDSVADREIAALIASSLAYGRVAQIVNSALIVLDKMAYPSRFLKRCSAESLRSLFEGFKHRFTTGMDLSSMLVGIKNVVSDYGSLYLCFKAGINPRDPDISSALCHFASRLREASHGGCATLIPQPENGSACKRLNLFLKWMVRRDRIDPGGWDGIDKSKLILPLDTHIHRIGRLFGMTERKQADMKTAREITEGFRQIAPEDPTKYDFALTRLGMKYGAGIADYFGDRSAEEILEDA
jgi:uncharacterized protein (TIGR02757 family)